jgi:hypothetical protein
VRCGFYDFLCSERELQDDPDYVPILHPRLDSPNPTHPTMLRRLSVRNLAVLAGGEIELGPGLNVLTGETGAGKSLVVDSLALLAGARAAGDLIREGNRGGDGGRDLRVRRRPQGTAARVRNRS